MKKLTILVITYLFLLSFLTLHAEWQHEYTGVGKMANTIKFIDKTAFCTSNGPLSDLNDADKKLFKIKIDNSIEDYDYVHVSNEILTTDVSQYSLEILPDGKIFYFVRMKNFGGIRLFISSDTGKTWTKSQEEFDNFFAINIKFFDNNLGFLVGAEIDGDCGVIYKTADGGSTWEVVYKARHTRGVTWNISTCITGVGFIDSDTVLAGGYDGLILKSTDRGETWREIYGANIYMIFTIEKFGNYIFAAGDVLVRAFSGEYFQQFYRSADNGETWEEMKIEGHNLPNAGMFSTAYHNSKIYLTTQSNANLSGGILLVSSDYGETWTKELEALPAETYSAMGISKDGIALIACMNGRIVYNTNIGAISEPTIIKNYSLFPNPASDDCTLSMDMTEASSMSISLSDILGRDIMQIYDGYADIGAFSKAFNTKHLASGVYSVIIRSGDKIKAEKLIINR